MLILTVAEGVSVDIRVPPSATARVVRVTVCKVQGGKARMAFDADRDISILRDSAKCREVQHTTRPVLKIGEVR